MTATISGDGTSTLINLTTSGNTVLGDASTDTLNVGNGGLVKDASGNVGIGTSTLVGYRVAVKQSSNTGLGSVGIASISSTNDTLIGMGYSSATDTCRILASYDSTGAFKPLTFLTSDAERMRIDSSGNVGIGTTPSAWFTSNNLKAMQLGGGSLVSYLNNQVWLASNYYLNSSGQDTYVGTGASNRLIMDGAYKFFTAASGTAGNAITFTQAMTLDSSGNLLVGITSSTDIAGTTNTGFLYKNKQLQLTSTGTVAYITAASSGSQTYISFYSQSTSTGSINTNGTTTTYSTTSDYRLKENIAPMTGALDKVAALKPVTYTWKQTGSADEGFIAHELQEVCPSAVTGEKDAVDENGNPVYQGIDTSFLVATLTAAIQEQQAIITALQADVEALKAQP